MLSLDVRKLGRHAQTLFEDGRPVLVRDPFGAESRFTYSIDGQLKAVTGPTSATADYHYDAKGRLSRIELSDGRCIEFQYAPQSGFLMAERMGRCS